VEFRDNDETPEPVFRHISPENLALVRYSDEKSKSIHLQDSDHQRDRGMSKCFDKPYILEEQDSIKRQLQSYSRIEERPSGLLESREELPLINFESNSFIPAYYTSNSKHIPKAKTVDFDLPKNHKKSRYEEIKEKAQKVQPYMGPNVKVFNESRLSLGKENRNARNLTFAKTDSNMSSMKSMCSGQKNKRIQKLEKLYSELSILESSMDQ